ncbi:Aldo/keto reductase [Ascobolus immersus RN42]|uniref:Aldo/keto reductase n=1 Tax=Ascobolus immersus RN42 TaxID=1160509 RepID=A0A3N4IEQ6_ASCIM|nr:Aldo/keto reductase [Ascobolus immersus RN42]
MSLPTIPTLPLVSSDPNAKIPVIGFGVGTTWFKRGADEDTLSPETVDAISTALKLNYTHIDGAETYKTEPEIGEALHKSSIPRKDLFVVTKLNDNLDDVQNAFSESLKKLGTDYVDLYLLHQPYFRHKEGGEEKLKAVWKEIEKIYESGRAKAIGVSNFDVEDLELLFTFATHKPSYNQIEFHPQLAPSQALLDLHRKHNILTSAYAPLTPILTARQDPSAPTPKVAKTVEEIGKKYGKTPGQVLLRWVLDQDSVVITTSKREERLKEYLGALGWELTKEEIDRIREDGSKEKKRAFWGQIEYLKKKDAAEGF